ncbi:TerB family tellurite resistance protein [Accumulibacter sp.]|uniref:TerB family tellurite resistance protein n=1 Tax=Accumulibacter sp. TaxID=2053492 RepID=UPI0025E7FFA1|nr:TerB family tellurite resistance protein [Accumulibacter sp.]MCM8595435.1 TerB family tellurite resistance protein [Accumulibacter sp.]MCM8626384.1 TerB family tellurite resistance protein [Accumulibacter sp.]MDS4049582.1 TerB family tellurite resistance protein [Accumulibacter sp.]
MLSIFADPSLDADQTIAATRLLLRIAHVDGARTDEEVTLIRQFYESGRTSAAGWPDFASLGEGAGDGEAGATFAEPEQRDLVLATCLLVGYADGTLSDDELAAVRAVAQEIGAEATRVDELLALVKDYMLAQLARLPDAASVAVVASELG